MKARQGTDRACSIEAPPSDVTIVELLHDDPERAWALFVDRYSDSILTFLRSMGFDHDQAMERFVYVCEKLCEDDFRRLKSFRCMGNEPALLPWLRTVVKNLCVNWTWSTEGRRRLLKPIRQLPAVEQQIFELYFWKGLSPSAIHEELRWRNPDVRPVQVLDALEHIFSLLSQKKLWRLLSNLARRRGTVSLDELGDRDGARFEPADLRANPEEALLVREVEERLDGALEALAPRQRLVVQFRYEEGLSVQEIGEMLHLETKEVKDALRTALRQLKRDLDPS